ncbi:MAG: tetratricopeptide repeat protein [Phycisphaerales bacterium]
MRANPTIPCLGLASLLALSSFTTFAAPPSQDATVHYRAGLGLVERGMHDLAIPELDAFLAASPDSDDAPNARYVLAVCHAKLGRRDEALTQLDRVVAVPGFAFQPDALLLAAQCELESGRAAQAIERLDRLKSAHADRAKEPNALALRAEALVAADRLTDARDALREAIARSPASATRDRLAYLLGRSESLLGDDAAAIKALKPIRSQSPPGPYAAHAAILEARSRLALGDAGAARRTLESITPIPADLADSFAYWNAVCERREGRVDAAEARLRAAIAAAPSSPLASDMLAELASADAQLGRHDDAAAAYAELLQRHPQSPHADRAAVAMGVALARAGQSREARVALERALHDRPALADELRVAATDELVELAAAEGDWSATERFAAELLRTDEASARAAELALRLGVAQAMQSNPGARATLERCMAMKSASDAVRVAARRQLLQIARRDGREADAQRLLAELADASPDALFDLAVAQASASQHAEAAASFERFATEHGADPRAKEAQARRLLALSRAGQRDAVLAAWPRIEPLVPMLEPSLRSAVRFEAALAFAANGKSDACLRELSAIADDGDAAAFHAHALVELARREYDAGRDDDTIAALARARAALAAAPESERSALDERASYLAGASRVRKRQWPEAAAALSDFLSRFPDSSMAPTARLLSGQSLLAAGRADEAVVVLNALVATSPGDDLLEPALVAIGQAHAALGRWDESEKSFATHLDRFPESARAPQSRFAIGWAREQRGRRDAAIEAYRQVASSGAGETPARAQFQIGECLFALDRHEDAVREFLKVDVLFAQPEWQSAALFEAGRCLTALGRTDDANRQFDDLLRRFPESQWAAAARRERERTAQASSATP